MERNYSFFAIPIQYYHPILIKFYAMYLAKKYNNGYFNNVNPRSSEYDSQLQKALPAAAYARYSRAVAAHSNGLESFPLFTAAIFAGNIAKLDASLLNRIALVYVLSRVLYSILYINTESLKNSYFRSMVFAWGTFPCAFLLLKSAFAVM